MISLDPDDPVSITPEADGLLNRLVAYYEKEKRVRALHNLEDALQTAIEKIISNDFVGRLAPSQYPELARYGFLWTKVGSYWIAYYKSDDKCVITGVFYHTNGIPGLMSNLYSP